MNTMAPTRPPERRVCRIRLTTGPAAAAEARSQVRATSCAWDAPADPDIAILPTSDLMTDAIGHETGQTVTLTVRCARGQLRVDVHRTSRSWPVATAAPSGAETGRDLILVARLPAERGCYRTPFGQCRVFHARVPAGPRRRRRTRSGVNAVAAFPRI